MTGAHIAYALATKLKMEMAGKRRGSDEPSPCVMYCGPSQQSVNVVLSKLFLKKNINDVRDCDCLCRLMGTCIYKRVVSR